MVGQRKKRYYDGQAKTDSEDNSMGDFDLDDMNDVNKLGMNGYMNSSTDETTEQEGSRGSLNICGGGESDDDGSD